MTTTDDAATARPSLRRPVPRDLLERPGCPFDPPPGLRKLREYGQVAPIELLNGSRAWVVTGFEEAIPTLQGRE